MISSGFKFLKKRLRPKGRIACPPTDIRFDTALRLREGGDYQSACSLLQSCIESWPNTPLLHFQLAETLRAMGEEAHAVMAYQTCLKLDDSDPHGAQVELWLMGRGKQPPTLPQAYVQNLFDQYAVAFDECLLNRLNYAAPRAIFDAVTAIRPLPFSKILDLGCGTGLSALPFQHKDSWIDGVDISSAMLEKAAAKKNYSGLHRQEIGGFLQDCAKLYNLLLCVDLFIYMGEIDALFKTVAAHLSSDGIFAFSVQATDHGDVILGQDHRYSHSENYIERCVAAAGLRILSCNPCDLRYEDTTPVQGMIFVCG